MEWMSEGLTGIVKQNWKMWFLFFPTSKGMSSMEWYKRLSKVIVLSVLSTSAPASSSYSEVHFEIPVFWLFCCPLSVVPEDSCCAICEAGNDWAWSIADFLLKESISQWVVKLIRDSLLQSVVQASVVKLSQIVFDTWQDGVRHIPSVWQYISRL